MHVNSEPMYRRRRLAMPVAATALLLGLLSLYWANIYPSTLQTALAMLGAVACAMISGSLILCSTGD